MLEWLKAKFQTARQYVPTPVVEMMAGAKAGIISFGSTLPAIEEARYQLKEEGVASDFLRVRAVPFTDEVGAFIRQHTHTYVVEMNRDGQLNQLLSLEYPQEATKLRSIAFTDGLPLTAHYVREAILAQEVQ